MRNTEVKSIKHCEMYKALKNHNQADESLLDELNFVMPVLFIIKESLQTAPTTISDNVPDYVFGCGWIVEKVIEHLDLAIKHAEETLQEKP
jgi:hypothetical protein